MKGLLSFLFVLILLSSPVLAQDAENECSSTPTIPVNMTPRFDEPTYDFTADLATIQKLGADAQHSIPEMGLTMGLTHYESVLEFRVPVKGVKFSTGQTCAHVDHVDVEIGYRNVTVLVAREVPQQSCGFHEIINHEQKHINVNREVLHEYAPLMSERLSAYLKQNGVLRGGDQESDMSRLHEDLQEILNKTAEEMNTENRRRQKLIDSPEEYRRVTAACDGQLGFIAGRYQKGR